MSRGQLNECPLFQKQSFNSDQSGLKSEKGGELTRTAF